MEGIIPGWCYQGPCTLSLPAPLLPDGSSGIEVIFMKYI